MSEFLKQFLRDDVRKLAPAGERALFLGTFGKHPGWNDHIEEDTGVTDLGLRTESLVLAKSILYVRGIGGCIDSGAWDKLEPAQQLPGFNHHFLWQAGGQFILGRLWSSRDGKGRTRYPMVLAAHALGVSLDWVLGVAQPRLEQLGADCAAATTAAEVAHRLNRAREELRAALTQDDAWLPQHPDTMSRFLQHPQFGAGREGLLRVLYQLQDQVTAYAPGRFNPRGNGHSLRPQECRAPAVGNQPAEIFWAWTRIMQSQLDPAAPVLFLWPVGADWVDILLGEPDCEQFLCLRTTTAKLPCASEIPFHLDADFRARAAAWIDALARGEPVQDPSAKPGHTVITRLFGSLFKGK